MRSPRVCYTNIENQQGDFQNTENLKIFATQIFLPPDSVEGEENLLWLRRSNLATDNLYAKNIMGIFYLSESKTSRDFDEDL